MTRLGGVTATLTMLLAVFVIGCGGGSDGASQEELDQARQEGAQQAKEQARMDALEAKLKQLSKQNKNASSSANTNGGSNSGGSPSGLTACTDGVSAGPNTTCAFAMNVAGEYGSNPGATTISAYSPVTGENYTMICSAYSAGHVCTGGNGASVYLP